MKLTGVIVTAAIIILGIYDLIVVVADMGIQYSVSRFLQNAGLEAPMVTFAIGFVAGHIFGYMPPKCPDDSDEDKFK